MRQAKWDFDKKKKIFQPVLKEEHVVREIVDRLWFQAKIKVWRIRERIPIKGRRWQTLSVPGIPDLVGFIPLGILSSVMGLNMANSGQRFAVPLFIEVKRPGGVHRPAQEAFIAEASSGGCIAFFATSWTDVVRELAVFGIRVRGD